MGRTIVMIENIRSMYNVGSIFRTLDGAGADELLIAGYTATPPRSQISKTALGAEQHVPWRHVPDVISEIKKLQESGMLVIAIETGEDSVSLDKLQISCDQDVCFVFGNEVEGISHEVLKSCDRMVSLPMRGIKESLNVSVTVGAVLYYPFRCPAS